MAGKKKAVKKAASPRPRAAKKGIEAEVARIARPAELYRTAVALHVLEAIGGSQLPTFTLTRGDGHDVFRLERPNGDWMKVVFTREAHLIFGFDHESPMSPYATQTPRLWPGLYAGLPGELRAFVSADDGDLFAETPGGPERYLGATFASWWTGGRWAHGVISLPEFDPYESDGAAYLIGAMTPQVVFVEERKWDAATVKRAMRHDKLSDDAIKKLRSGADVPAVRTAMRAVGYGEPFPFRE